MKKIRAVLIVMQGPCITIEQTYFHKDSASQGREGQWDFVIVIAAAAAAAATAAATAVYQISKHVFYTVFLRDPFYTKMFRCGRRIVNNGTNCVHFCVPLANNNIG